MIKNEFTSHDVNNPKKIVLFLHPVFIEKLIVPLIFVLMYKQAINQKYTSIPRSYIDGKAAQFTIKPRRIASIDTLSSGG